MEIDDYLSQLRGDLQNRIDEVDRSLNETLGVSHSGQIFCPECGTRLTEDVNFCPNCGTPIHDDNSDPSELEETESLSTFKQEGILFTDVRVLAEKYNCCDQDIINTFELIILNSGEKGIRWHFLDANNYILDDLWIDYNQAISDFMEENHISYGLNTPVFIIGGDDVIPVPRVEDPFGSSDDGRIPCDMCYCFTGNFFSDIWDGDRTVSEENVRNTIARLPLENGSLSTSFKDDIYAYFEDCMLYYDGGIPVDGVMMSSNASWKPASRTMSEHLPLVQDATDESIVDNDMYICPPVSPQNKDSIIPVKKTLNKVDMLMFNLHGTDSKGMSGFYSDSGEAFNTSLLDYTDAKVLNTVACYGARYFGYSRDDSMLLSSIFKKGFLLYTGSLICVPMTELEVPDGVDVHPGSGSEHLMPIFCMEQYSGIHMGKALMKAKLEYFNTFRYMERDDFSMATMMMFSLYGNPLLTMRRNEDVLLAAQQMHVLPEISKKSNLKNMPLQRKTTQRIWDSKTPTCSLLDEVRSAVDAGLNEIHKRIQRDLYDYLGLEPRWLDHIDKYSIPTKDGDVEEGFIYAYDDKTKQYGNKTWVEVDNSGKVRRKYTTK